MAQVLTFYMWRFGEHCAAGTHKTWEKGPSSTVLAETAEPEPRKKGPGSTVPAEAKERKSLELKGSGSMVPAEADSRGA